MPKIFLILVLTVLISACSSNSDELSIKAPAGINQEFYEESVSVVELINNRMSSDKKLTDKDKKKLEAFFNENKPSNETESDIYGLLSKLYPTYKIYCSTTGKSRDEVLLLYNEDYNQLTQILNLK